MRFRNRISSRFQSNHQRGYFWRKTIINTTGSVRIPAVVIEAFVACPPQFA
jgi:hypothetical protein